MAKNTGKGHRVGAVKGRSELQHNGQHFKRDTATGRISTAARTPTRASATRRSSAVLPGTAARRAARRAGVAVAAPAAGGGLLAAVVLAGEPVEGVREWAVRGLLLVPVVLVHCHRRAERHRVGWLEGMAASVAAGAVAYMIAAVGLAAGAAAALGLAVAVQTGALTVVVQLAGLFTAAIAVRAARRPALSCRRSA